MRVKAQSCTHDGMNMPTYAGACACGTEKHTHHTQTEYRLTCNDCSTSSALLATERMVSLLTA